MSRIEQEEKKKSNEQNSRQRYENLNNNELKFKKKTPSTLNNKEYDSYSNNSSDSYRNQRYSPYSRSNHKRYNSRSRSRSNSKYRHSHYNERRYDDYHHHRHHRHRRHHRDYSDRKNNDRNREEEEEYMRREILKNNSISAFLQGKSSNIFYDDNYSPISSNPYKYLGKPNLDDIGLDKLNEIPVSPSDICKKDFELYVVNLPQDLAEDQIKELLNTALISIEANEQKGEPITKVTKPKNGKFFLLEFRSRSECKNAIKLNGMRILNRTLKIGIPNYLNEKDGNNNPINNNANSSTHDLFPILSSFEKEFDYKKGYGVDINSFTDYQNKVNNLISGQNLLYNIPFMYSSSSLNLEQKRNGESSIDNTKPEPGTKLHIINIPENFDENGIYILFKKFGKIKKIELLKNEETKKFNGQCYLEYEKEKSYQDAINYGNGLKLGDNFLLINRVNPKDNNKTESTKINYLEKGNYKSTSSLGILGSSINLQSYQNNKTLNNPA